MLLAVDCGNTNMVFAAFEGAEALGAWRIRTDEKRTADEYAVWLTQAMGLAGVDWRAIDGMIVASVVPAAIFNLERLAQRYFKLEPMVVGRPGIDLGMKVMIDRPQQAGADRLVNGVGAHARFDGALVIIDFGTGTTFDIIDGAGNYRGGIIAPGINHSLEALYQVAARLPRVDIRKPEHVIGSDTVTAMQSGVYWGYVGLIEGIVARVRADFPEPLTVIATGGLAPLFADATDVIDHVDGDITMRGLRLIHERNLPSAT